MEDTDWNNYLARKKKRDDKKKIKEENKLRKKEETKKRREEDKLRKKEENKKKIEEYVEKIANKNGKEENDDGDKLKKRNYKPWVNYLERKKNREDKKKIKEENKLRKKEENKKKREEDRLRKNKENKKVDYILKDSDIKSGQLKLSDSTINKNRRYKGRYRQYVDALKSKGILEEIKGLLDKQDFIIVRNADIAERLGKIFIRRSTSTIYWALKYVLFHEGIVCQLRTSIHDAGKTGTLLFMRKRKDEDCLAPSLQHRRKKIIKYKG